MVGPGTATGIGSLPHADADAAAQLVLAAHPELPAAPQLPQRSPREGMVAQWIGALGGVSVAGDGAISVAPGASLDVEVCSFEPDAHGGLLTFLDQAMVASPQPVAVKAQITGPLTLGLALVHAGAAPDRAFRATTQVACAWMRALDELLAARLPAARRVIFVDEPGLVAWSAGEPWPREHAVDALSGVLAAAPPQTLTGVHVCGSGDLRMALEAGPAVLSAEATPMLEAAASALSRHLEHGGTVAWGAVPTDRPLGETCDAAWKRLVALWCDLARLGCDLAQLRAQSMVTPACGLAGHGRSQAERALRITAEIGARVREHALFARRSFGT
jgi:methionine synthase II (cobalamin-independent)